MPRFLHVLVLVLACALVGGSTAQAAPVGGVAVAGIGAGARASNADLDSAKAAKAKLVRIELSWNDLEPVRAGERNPAVLAELDTTIASAKKRGLKVVLLVQSTPCWTSTAPSAITGTCAPGYNRYPPADYGSYANLVAFVAARYKSALAAVEVWNEPDQSNERYWAGPDKVARYAALLKATYPVVKRAAPKVPVLGGAFVGTNGIFLDALYKAGIKGSYDGISVHFYDLPLLGLRTTRAVQRRYKDTKPLWLLEAGWNSCRPAKRGTEGQPCTTQAYQAKNLRNLFAQTRGTKYLKAIVVYKLRDDPVDRFGIIDRAGKRKRSFGALQSSFVRRQTVSRLTLHAARRNGRVRVYGSGPEGDAFQLQVRIAGRLRYIANFRLNASNGYSLTLPAQLGTRGLGLVVRSLWTAKKRATGRT